MCRGVFDFLIVHQNRLAADDFNVFGSIFFRTRIVAGPSMKGISMSVSTPLYFFPVGAVGCDRLRCHLLAVRTAISRNRFQVSLVID